MFFKSFFSSPLRIIQVAVFLALVATVVSLGVLLRGQYVETGKLSSDLASANEDLAEFERANGALADQIAALNLSNVDLIAQIRQSDIEKNSVRNQLDSTQNELRKIFLQEPDFASVEVPASVQRVIDSQLDRLWQPAPNRSTD